MTSEIHVTGMRCKGCEMLVTEALEEMDGVEAAHASHEEGIVRVEYDEARVGFDALRRVIEGQGFSVSA